MIRIGRRRCLLCLFRVRRRRGVTSSCCCSSRAFPRPGPVPERPRPRPRVVSSEEVKRRRRLRVRGGARRRPRRRVRLRLPPYYPRGLFSRPNTRPPGSASLPRVSRTGATRPEVEREFRGRVVYLGCFIRIHRRTGGLRKSKPETLTCVARHRIAFVFALVAREVEQIEGICTPRLRPRRARGVRPRWTTGPEPLVPHARVAGISHRNGNPEIPFPLSRS